jgi:hypothetical protein
VPPRQAVWWELLTIVIFGVFFLSVTVERAAAVISGTRPSIARVTAAIPATLLVFFTGLLWLAGLACRKERRDYVTVISQQAMRTASTLLDGGSESDDFRILVHHSR